MERTAYYISLMVLVGCSLAVTYKVFDVSKETRLPTHDEILDALREGAAKGVVSQAPQVSDN
jgi:hypothetical protein